MLQPGTRNLSALKNPNKVPTIAVISVVVAFYIVMMLLQDGIVDTADGILHYQYARFSFAHPENLFNHWAKPVFTTIMAIPAQFGMTEVKFMNVFLIALTSYITIKTATELKLKLPYLAGLFVGLGNSITYVVLGGLTEVLFMLAFSAVIYFAVTRKWKWMYVILGSTLLIRPESIVVIPLFGLLGLIQGKWVNAVYGLIIPAIYTLGGVLVAGFDWSYIFTGQPYQAESVYGAGDWFHYLREWSRISPYSLLVLAAVAIPSILKHKISVQSAIILSAFGIIGLHVVLWKFGAMGSAGLVRTLITAIPALALTGYFTVSWLHQQNKWSTVILLGIFLFEIYDYNRFPIGTSPREKAAMAMADSIKKIDLKEDTQYAYQFATTAFYLDLDPFNENQVIRLWSLNKTQASNSLKNGDILIWDNLTGHREGNLPWERVTADQNLVRLDSVSFQDATLVSFRVSK